MDAILLKKKSDSKTNEDLVVFDELIRGVLTPEWFIPVFTGSHNGVHFMPLSFLIDNYCFPEKEGQLKAKFLHFIRGFAPELIEQMEFYESDEIKINY